MVKYSYSFKILEYPTWGIGMQSSNRLLGDIARLASGAMTMAAGAKTELEQLIQQRVERFLNEKGWVAREEFDAVRSLAQRAREEQEKIHERLDHIEKKLSAKSGGKSRPTVSKAKTTKPSSQSNKS